MDISPRTVRAERLLCLVALAVYGVSFLLPAAKLDGTVLLGYHCFW